mgnify:CR=1 FL=1
MCGFVGFTGMRAEREAILHRMADRIIHRGPDMEGYHLSGDTPENAVALGFRRLSIIDLAAGKQPMYNEDGTVVVVFNGEIFNFMDLRTELQAKGHIFKTHCDTEVILHGYEEYGTALAAKLRGMFAFVVCDTKTNTLYGARDMFGIKPFYYTQTSEGELLFGSEIKSLLEHPGFRREVNAEALRPYLTFQYSAMNETFFKGTYKLPPAHWFEYKNGQMHIERYWDADFRHKTSLTYEQAADEIDARVRESVAAHRISDVKLGSFLSGGVDSSYVAAIANVDKTFTVGFGTEERYNEIGWAKGFSEAIGKKNYSKVIEPEEYWAHLPMIQYHMDEPLADPAAVALYFVCNLASQSLKVVLSGEGADEIFGGYNVYSDPGSTSYEKLPRGLRRGIMHIAESLPAHRGVNFFVRKGKDLEERFIGNAYMFTPKDRKALLKIHTNAPDPMAITKPYYDQVKDQDDVTKMQYIDINLWMIGDILLKADRMSMANALEVRVPFCDYRIAEYLYNVPWEMKEYKGYEKGLLRAAMQDYLPEKVLWRKKSPYPKTHNPNYLQAVRAMLAAILQDPKAPLFQLVKREAIEQLLLQPSGVQWYGQLMAYPQTIAYFVQMNAWLQAYDVKIVE